MVHIFPLSLLFMIAYFVIILSVSKIFSRQIKTLKDYFLAGRTLGALPVTLTFVASWFGAGSMMGTLDALYLEGMSALWKIAIPSIISCVIITIFFAKRVADVSDQHSLSQPEAIEKSYGRLGRFLLAIIILMSITVFIGSQLVAAGGLFHQVLGVDRSIAILGVTALVVTYTLLGGYFTVVVTDVVQFILFSLALVILAIFTVGTLIAHPALVTHWLATPRVHAAGFWDLSKNLAMNLSMLLTFVMAWSIAPEMWQRMSSTQNRVMAQQAAGAATVCLIGLFGLVSIIGLLSSALITQLGPTDHVLITLAQQLPHESLTALVLVGFLAAVTSTMDSSLNVGSLTLSQDLYKGFVRPHATTRELIWASRVATVVVVIPSVIIAMGHENIIQVLWLSADIYASAMFFPIIGLLFFKNVPRLSGILAMSLGLSTVLLNAIATKLGGQLGGVTVLMWPYSTLLSVLLSGLGFAAGWALQVFQKKTVQEPVSMLNL